MRYENKTPRRIYPAGVLWRKKEERFARAGKRSSFLLAFGGLFLAARMSYEAPMTRAAHTPFAR